MIRGIVKTRLIQFAYRREKGEKGLCLLTNSSSTLKSSLRPSKRKFFKSLCPEGLLALFPMTDNSKGRRNTCTKRKKKGVWEKKGELWGLERLFYGDTKEKIGALC